MLPIKKFIFFLPDKFWASFRVHLFTTHHLLSITTHFTFYNPHVQFLKHIFFLLWNLLCLTHKLPNLTHKFISFIFVSTILPPTNSPSLVLVVQENIKEEDASVHCRPPMSHLVSATRCQRRRNAACLRCHQPPLATSHCPLFWLC